MYVQPPHRGHDPSRPRPAPVGESIPPPVVAESVRAAEGAPSRVASLWRLLLAGWFVRLRIVLLSTVLVAVMGWGVHDWADRRARTQWQRPLKVALVLVEREPVSKDTLARLNTRVFELERRLAQEHARYTGRDFTPFEIVVRGPVRSEAEPPSAEGNGVVELLQHGLRLWRWTSAIDSAAHVELGYDSRVYLVLKPVGALATAFVEGESEFRGRVGIARADIARDTLDFSLFVAAHELLHTLGASDKYDAAGRACFPEGFAEPWRVPLFPQPAAEVMARNLPYAPYAERPPERLDELRVGELTAREIGWLK